jgi:hypothetical protein
MGTGPLQFVRNYFFIGKQHLIFSSKNFVRQIVQRIMSFRGALFRTQNQTNRVGSLIHPMLVCVIQVEVQLSGIRVAEPIHFEIDDNQATKSPMKKEEIDQKPRIVNAKPLLSSQICEVVSEF